MLKCGWCNSMLVCLSSRLCDRCRKVWLLCIRWVNVLLRMVESMCCISVVLLIFLW